jgi:hypothetical protein
MATEAVLFEKLGENEVVEAIDFGTNQHIKLRNSEHPTRRDAKGEKTACFPSKIPQYYLSQQLEMQPS